MRARTALLLLLVSVACKPALSVPEAAQIHCTSDHDCPSGLVCQKTLARCVSKLLADSEPPQLVSAVAANPESVVLTFSEPISSESAEMLESYVIAPPLAVDSVALAADGQTVVLAVQAQQDKTSYVVTVEGIRDLAQNVISAPNNQATFVGVAAVPDSSPPDPILPPWGTRLFGASSVTLRWGARAGAASYQVEVAYDAGFIQQAPGSPYTVAAPATELKVSLSEPVTTYWRVRADITSTDAYGASMFEVMGDTLYVFCIAAEVCSDSGRAGNITNPYATINRALADAKEHGIGRVEVADRGAGAAYEELVLLQDGVSMYGGYSESFASLDPDSGAYVTAIHSDGVATVYGEDISNPTTLDRLTLLGGNSGVVHTVELLRSPAILLSRCDVGGGVATQESVGVRLLESGRGSTSKPTLLDNVVVASDAAVLSAGIYADNSDSVLQGNTVVGGVASGYQGLSYGVYATGGVALLDNTVTGGASSQSSGSSYGAYLYTDDSTDSVRIEGNIIRGGTAYMSFGLASSTAPVAWVLNNDICGGTSSAGFGTSCGLLAKGIFAFSAPDTNTFAVNNTICGGDAHESMAVWFDPEPNDNLSLVNNILFTHQAATGTPTQICVRVDENPLALENNLLFDCPAALVRWNLDVAPVDITDIAQVNDSATFGTNPPTTSGNLTDAAAEGWFQDFAAGDLHLGTGAPDSVRYGGLDTSGTSYGTVTTDRDGAARTCTAAGTACYSVGAYESD